MRARWMPTPPNPLLVSQLAASARIAPLLAQCLINRGIDEGAHISRFLAPRLKDLADPFLLPDMERAVDRLFLAHGRREGIAIFGDYDVDGVTSTALLHEFLTALGWQVNCYVPDRFDEGYGLTVGALENCLAKCPATLVLAVDCGSNSVGPIADLPQKGIDVIVLDHHQVCEPRPAAVALVNPQRPTPVGNTPGAAAFTELCSVGLAFKLAHAVLKKGRATGFPGAADFDLRTTLDLVALGTIADLAPLTGENRILVSAGLERLNTTQRPGLMALKAVARCSPSLGGYEVGFQLAPRLNAAGRMENAEAALHLLLSKNPQEAATLAKQLDEQNRERQRVERSISQEALQAVRGWYKPEDHYVIVEGHASWHIGVVGIVASRVLQQFYRPVIIVGGEGNGLRGSGRSIPGFDLGAALRECSDLLVRHGGHSLAAGVSLEPAKLGEFRERLNLIARRTLAPEDLRPALRLDAEVELPEITLECVAALEKLKPTGQGNPTPQLFSRNLVHARPLQRMGSDRQHVKMWVSANGVTHEAVWWGGGQESLPVGRFDLAYVPQINEFNGRRTVQLKVLDWRPTEGI